MHDVHKVVPILTEKLKTMKSKSGDLLFKIREDSQ